MPQDDFFLAPMWINFRTIAGYKAPKRDAMEKLERLMRRQEADGEYRPPYNGNPDYSRYLVEPPTGIHESLHTLMSSDWTRWLFVRPNRNVPLRCSSSSSKDWANRCRNASKEPEALARAWKTRRQ
jgi:hypothetical protein